MRDILAAFFILAATAAEPAVTAPAQGHCRVVGVAKLPASAGGAQALCAAIEESVAEHAPDVRFTAEVKVVKPSMLTATLVVNGRALPEQKFAIMDRELSAASIKRFADSIAREVAKAAKA